MPFELLCTVIIGVILGLIICFAGYRFFLLLLPIWGFFAGFALGAGAMTAFFGDGFLATTTSWVVGFVVALVFAVLSYLFYAIGVAILAGSFGYALGTGLMYAIGFAPGFIAAMVGIVVAVVVVGLTFYLNLQKWIIVVITALGGGAMLIGVTMMLFGGLTLEAFGNDGVVNAIMASPFWIIVWLVLAGAGIFAQIALTRTYVIDQPGYMERSI